MSDLFQITDHVIDTKTDFIAAIRRFVTSGALPTSGDPVQDGQYRERGFRLSCGQLLLVGAIADYFEAHTEIPDDEFGFSWFHDLRKYLVQAFEEFRTAPHHQALRDCYKGQTGGDAIPDLLDARGGLVHQSVVRDIVELFPKLTGRRAHRVERDLMTYFNAEVMVIDHAWKRFVRRCYRSIAPKIKAARHSGGSGIFGRTMLRYFCTGGRVMYTFARSNVTVDVSMLEQVIGLVEASGVTAENKLAAIEAVVMSRRSPDAGDDLYQLWYVADENDMYGFRAGLQTVRAPYTECVAMIHDVIDHWDVDKIAEDGRISLVSLG